MKKVVYPQAFKDFVTKCVQRHAWNLKVQHYLIHVIYKKEDRKTENDKKIAAEISQDRRYLTADIIIYPRTLDEWVLNNKDEIENIVAHELSHILTKHLFDLGVSAYKDEGEMHDAWESLTENICRLSLEIEKQRNKKLGIAKKKR